MSKKKKGNEQPDEMPIYNYDEDDGFSTLFPNCDSEEEREEILGNLLDKTT